MHQGGLQWCTVFIADFGLFLHHIGSDSNPGMTLEEPSRLRDRNVLRSSLYQSKEKFTSKLTWIKPLLKTIQSVFNFYLIPLFEAEKKKKRKTPVYLAHEIIYCRLIHTYLPRYPSPFIINLCSYYQSNAYF